MSIKSAKEWQIIIIQNCIILELKSNMGVQNGIQHESSINCRWNWNIVDF